MVINFASTNVNDKDTHADATFRWGGRTRITRHLDI